MGALGCQINLTGYELHALKLICKWLCVLSRAVLYLRPLSFVLPSS